MSAWRRDYAKRAVWFLLPAGMLLGVFALWPLLRAAYLGCFEVDLLALERAQPVGLAHYAELLSDPRFRRAFANTALFAVLVVPVQTSLAFALALWVNRPEPAWRFLRVVFFVPTVVALPALAVVWSLIYQPAAGGESGPLNAVLGALGCAPRAFLREPTLALPAIAFMSLWQGVGLQMMIFLAGLQGVSRDQLDAARLDGANGWQRVWYVVVPTLRNTFAFVVTATTILAFRLFVQPYLMTRGGPGNSTFTLVQAIYEMTFVAHDLGRACAASLLLLAWVAFLTLALRVVLREERA